VRGGETNPSQASTVLWPNVSAVSEQEASGTNTIIIFLTGEAVLDTSSSLLLYFFRTLKKRNRRIKRIFLRKFG
jgi:hypothetical protein